MSIRCSLAAAASLLAACSGHVAVDAEGDAGTVTDGAADSPADMQGSEDQAAEAPPPTEAGADDASGEDGPEDLLTRLEAIPGMVVAYETWSDPYREVHLEYDQPVDHADPAGPRFRQRLTLLHVSESAPMTLYSTGYFLFGDNAPAELTWLTGGNQLAVEHRYFDPSAPSPMLWEHLTIEQAAADHHRIVEAMRPLYPARWLSTGHSKGGMTSVYHRRFHPDDVDGTVAYVAPLSLAAGDERYVAFLEQVGDAACRARLAAVQRTLLERKAGLLTYMGNLGSFDILGAEMAFEHGVVEAPFTFWQYWGSSYCPSVPGPGASDPDLWSFLTTYSGLPFTTDDMVLAFRPYFYQAGTQLGFPAYDESGYADLETHPGTDNPASYGPPGWPMLFDPSSMADIDAWVSTQGRTLMFVYGEEDPWSAAPFRLGEAEDSFLFQVPNGTHGALLSDLPPTERAVAFEAVGRWLGASIPVATLDQGLVEGFRSRILRAPH